MIDVKVLAVDKKGSGGTSGGHTNTTAYVPKDIVVSSIRLGDIFLSYDKDNNAIKVAKTDGGAANFYALGGISALGVGGLQGGGGTSYNRLDSWEAYDASKAGWVLSALLGNDLNARVTSLENGQIEGVATQEWVQSQGYLTELSAATINALGAIKIGYSANDKNYPVLLDNNNRAYVSVPWSDTTYSFVDANPILDWGTKSKVATVGGVDIHVTMPANPNTWRPLGTGATDACAGNDARLSDARPASDVYAWAKASTKPTYTLDEVADGSSRKLSDYLPLTGGTISRRGTSYPLRINNPTGQNVRLVLELAEVIKGSIAYNDSRGTYIAVGDVSPSIYMGIKTDGTPYVVNDSVTENVIWHAGNDGANSGLDADLLDGQHGSYYAKATDVATLQGYFTNGVANNADKLDGYHASNFARLYIHNSEWSDIADIPSNLDIGFHSVHVSTKEVSALLVGKDYGGSEWQIYFHPDKNYTDEVYYRKPSKNLVRTFAFTNSNVASATKLATARTINGTSFDGSANITTANWGTARNISIADSDSTNTGSAVSVNGSAAVTLKLPATIKATLSGNAATATTLATPRTIWGQSFDGSANVSGAMTGVTNVDNLMHFDTVNGNGRVGIGTSTPDFPLSVYGNIATHFWVDSRAIVIEDERQTAGYQKIEFNRGGAEDRGGIHWFHDQFGGYSFNSNCVNIVANNGYVTLGAWNAPALLVTPTDNVGIGTSAPEAKLHVVGSAAFSGAVRFVGVESDDIEIGDGQDGDITNLGHLSALRKYIQFGWYGHNWRIGNVRGGDTSSAGFGVVSGTDTLKLLVANNATRVFGDLTVDNNIDASGTIHSATGIYSNGYVSALGQNTSSDERLKDIKSDIDLPIDVLSGAPSKVFEWRRNRALGEQAGTIAQYWQRALPQVVHDRGDGYLSMQYDVAALIGVISVAKRVQNHEERIKELERENEALREQLKEFKG